jgi:hypothetical protein
MNTIGYALFIALWGGLLGATIRAAISSRKRDLIACTIVAAAGGIGLGAFGPAIGLSPLGSAATTALAVGIVLFISTMSRRSLLRSVTMAPAVREFALANFDRLDFDGDGTISRVDLEITVGGNSLTESERKLAKRMAWDLCHIGHVIQTITSVSPHTGAVAHINVYGANRQDLETYPERIRAKYTTEYGDR